MLAREAPDTAAVADASSLGVKGGLAVVAVLDDAAADTPMDAAEEPDEELVALMENVEHKLAPTEAEPVTVAQTLPHTLAVAQLVPLFETEALAEVVLSTEADTVVVVEDEGPGDPLPPVVAETLAVRDGEPEALRDARAEDDARADTEPVLVAVGVVDE